MRKMLMGVAGVLLAVGVTGAMLPMERVYAAGDICSSLSDKELKNAAGCDTEGTVPDILRTVISVIISLMGVAAVGVIMYGGFLLMTSAGDAAKTTKGRRVIIYAVAGLVVAILAYVIVNFVIGVAAPATSNQAVMVVKG